MEPDSPVHAPRPSRSPLRHVLPKRLRKHDDPFAVRGDHRPLRANANPEESRVGDSWTAVKAGLAILVAAGLVTWIFIALFR